jgi:DHA2 family multidrug resistance protein
MATAQNVINRVPITACLVLASLMNAIDSTIANVALPHMQGSFSASQDQMAWVLTSYIVSAAIMTPLSGWLGARIGYKPVFLISIAGFTIASMLCGSATSLAEIVAFRLLQGLCGASVTPLSQAVMLDLFPPRAIGQVMALWGAASLLGPIIGPLLGGWLTDNFSWRWVFYINLPLGIVSFVGVWLLTEHEPGSRRGAFDFLGFGALAVFIGGLQLALDRGPTQDWFSSPEIWIETICAAIGFYVFIVHTLAARNPFFDRALALDRNFVLANFYNATLGLLLFSTLALQPPMIQGLLGYSVFGAGLIMSPRGLGTLASMLVVGQLVGRVDIRVLMMVGLTLLAISMMQMSHFSLQMDSRLFIVSGLFQGVGMGLMFVPITALGFVTLSPHLRGQATSAFALVRSLGQSVGISLAEAMLTNRAAVAHGDLAAAVQATSPALAAGLPPQMNPATASGLLDLNAEISRQAAMVGYVDVFHVGLLATLAMMPLVFFLRPPKTATHVADVQID